MNHKPQVKAKPIDPTDGPRAHPGDSVYFNHAQHGPMSGKVLASGAHGCTVKCDQGKHHKVRWGELHGHKQRVERKASIIDQGEDGSICETEDGKRFFLQGSLEEEEKDPTAKMAKALSSIASDLRRLAPVEELMAKTILLVNAGSREELLAKAIKGQPGVALQTTTDKTGHTIKRWKKIGIEQKAPDKSADPDPHDQRGSAKGYGTKDIQPGHKVKFKAGEHAGEGEVAAVGKDGMTVKDASGREHQVHHHEITHSMPGDDAPKTDVKNEVKGDQAEVEPEKFSADDYAAEHDDPDVSADSILEHFPEDTKDRIAAAQDRLKSIEQTIDTQKKNGKWTAQRTVLHHKIIGEMLSPEAVKRATPAEGQKPKFIILGGRGGSGKSSFDGTVYDSKQAIVLDADHIKGMIPEYEGWNAAQVHEESGEIFDKVTELARALGLNVVLDKTMKTAKSAIADVNAFKEAGYQTEAHYMHLPRQEAAKRAVGRFLNGGEKGRYVPVDVVLSNTTNEKAFDQVKHLVDDWSFRDNNVPKGSPPILISQKGKGGDEPAPMQKAESRQLIWSKL